MTDLSIGQCTMCGRSIRPLTNATSWPAHLIVKGYIVCSEECQQEFIKQLLRKDKAEKLFRRIVIPALVTYGVVTAWLLIVGIIPLKDMHILKGATALFVGLAILVVPGSEGVPRPGGWRNVRTMRWLRVVLGWLLLFLGVWFLIL